MADGTTATQWYKLQGANQQWYSVEARNADEAKAKVAGYGKPPTQQAGSPAAMSDYKRQAKEKAAQNQGQVTYGGISYPATAAHAPYFGMTPSNVVGSAGRMAKEFGTSLIDTARDLASNPNWFATQPEGQRPSTMQKFVTEPAMAESAKAQELWKQGGVGNRVEAAGRFAASGIPMIGPMIAGMGETAGRGDIGGALGQAVGLYATGKVAKEGPEMVVDKATGMISPESLRLRAAKLNTELLKTAESGPKGYRLSTGLQVAKEGVVSGLKELPNKIEAKRFAKNVQVQRLAQQLDTQGTTIDISRDMRPIIQDVAKAASQQGLWTPQLRNQITSLLKRVTERLDPTTGQTVARDLTQLKPSEVLALQKGLEDLSAFGKERPQAINNLARRIRGLMGDKLGATSPEMQRLRAEESNLIRARDAARTKYADVLNGNRKMSFMGIYRDIPTIGAYMLLRSAIGWMPAVGTTLTLRALAKSAVSTTARAALYAKAAEVIDASLGRGPWPGAAGQRSWYRPGGPGGVPPTGSTGGGMVPVAKANAAWERLQKELYNTKVPDDPPKGFEGVWNPNDPIEEQIPKASLVQQTESGERAWKITDPPYSFERAVKLLEIPEAGSIGRKLTPSELKVLSKVKSWEEFNELETQWFKAEKTKAPKVKKELTEDAAVGQQVPTAPSSVVSTNPPIGRDVVPPTASAPMAGSLPSTATAAGAAASSGFFDAVKAEHPEWSMSQQLQEAAKRESAARAKPPAAPASANMPTPASRAASQAAFEKNFPSEKMPEMSVAERAAWQQSAFGEKPPEDVGAKVRAKQPAVPRGSVAESNIKPTKVAEGQSGLDPKQKAMMDRLDKLIERQSNPKSGADRVAIEREINQIKRILKGEEEGTANKGDRKKIADRERLAAKRAKAKAATPGGSTAAPTSADVEKAIASGATPEQRAILLDQGYKKLASYENGSVYVDALRKQAQDLAKAGVTDYDEMSALADAINALKELEGK